MKITKQEQRLDKVFGGCKTNCVTAPLKYGVPIAPQIQS
jgi:hypothetical protein